MSCVRLACAMVVRQGRRQFRSAHQQLLDGLRALGDVVVVTPNLANDLDDCPNTDDDGADDIEARREEHREADDLHGVAHHGHHHARIM
jgi:hypothetical protein